MSRSAIAVRLSCSVVLMCFLLFAALLFRLFGRPHVSPRVVDDKIIPNGIEVAIVEWFDGPTDLYSSTLFVKLPCRQYWYAYYLDHDSSYWWKSKLSWDQGLRILRIFKNGVLKAEWERDSMYTFHPPDHIQRGPMRRVHTSPAASGHSGEYIVDTETSAIIVLEKDCEATSSTVSRTRLDNSGTFDVDTN